MFRMERVGVGDPWSCVWIAERTNGTCLALFARTSVSEAQFTRPSTAGTNTFTVTYQTRSVTTNIAASEAARLWQILHEHRIMSVNPKSEPAFDAATYFVSAYDGRRSRQMAAHSPANKNFVEVLSYVENAFLDSTNASKIAPGEAQ